MKAWKAIILAITVIGFASCKKDKGYGAMSVKMTDAPGDYVQVNVDIRSVEIHYADEGKANKGWMTLKTNAGVYDLLTLRNNVTTVIADDVNLPSGKVTQMRLILGDSNSVVVDSMGIFPLEIPSGENTGLKINVDAEIKVDDHLEITLDFDANESIHMTGAGQYKLQPVIRVKDIHTR